jgi:hypothetical protein
VTVSLKDYRDSDSCWAGVPCRSTATQSIPPALRRGGMRLQVVFLFPKLTKEQQKMLLEQKMKQMQNEPPQK